MICRHVIGGRGVAMNCWRLLDATAARFNHNDTKAMLDLLVSYRYCKPTNAILGPLVRAHLNQ